MSRSYINVDATDQEILDGKCSDDVWGLRILLENLDYDSCLHEKKIQNNSILAYHTHLGSFVFSSFKIIKTKEPIKFERHDKIPFNTYMADSSKGNCFPYSVKYIKIKLLVINGTKHCDNCSCQTTSLQKEEIITLPYLPYPVGMDDYGKIEVKGFNFSLKIITKIGGFEIDEIKI